MNSGIGKTARAVCLAVLAVASVTATARAQVIRGTVRDVVTHQPIPKVNVGLLDARDSAVATATTTDSGKFSFKAPRPGTYALNLRHIAYTELTTTRADMIAGDTVTITIDMAANGVMLDTVVSKETETRGVFKMTSGAEYVRQHYIANKGLIISGYLIERSGMTMSEYLGKMPGVHLSGTTPKGTPVVPAGKGEFLLADGGSQCLYARIDRFSLLYMLMQNHAESIDDVVRVKDVMAVEVYRSHREVPPEWGQDAVATELYSRLNQGNTYVIGHTGFPAIDKGGSNKAGDTGGMTLLAQDNLDFGTTALDPDDNRPPPCGFVQIWTGAAWGDRGKGGTGPGDRTP